MDTTDRGPELMLNAIDREYADMQPRYHRCANGHMDLWYAGDPPCPLCEVRERGWAKPENDPLNRWANKK